MKPIPLTILLALITIGSFTGCKNEIKRAIRDPYLQVNMLDTIRKMQLDRDSIYEDELTNWIHYHQAVEANDKVLKKVHKQLADSSEIRFIRINKAVGKKISAYNLYIKK